MADGKLFDDLFNVTSVDKGGKKFDRGQSSLLCSALGARCRPSAQKACSRLRWASPTKGSSGRPRLVKWLAQL
jgi:hypothetical protein